jgi:hypothetical protein
VVAAATWFESLAIALRPLQRRLAETNFLSANCDLGYNFVVHHKPLMIDDSIANDGK